MMYNLNKVCSQENIETIENEEFALEGYALEIVRILKKGQQDKVNRKNAREGKRTGEEERQKTRREENLEKKELRGHEVEQDLGKREKEMDEKIIENQAKWTKKRKEREEKEEEDKHKKKPKSTEVKRKDNNKSKNALKDNRKKVN